jgi:hypothetical protein
MRRLICMLIVTCAAPAVEADRFVDWIAAHGASQSALDHYEYTPDSCDEITVGPHHEAALQCSWTEDVSRPIAGEDEPAYRVVEHYAIRTVRAHDVVTLIDVPVRAQALDAMPLPLNAPRKPWNPFVVASDGMAITVGDPDDAKGCRGARRKPAAGATKRDRVWDELDNDLHARICKARGTWVWRRERFQRKA